MTAGTTTTRLPYAAKWALRAGRADKAVELLEIGVRGRAAQDRRAALHRRQLEHPGDLGRVELEASASRRPRLTGAEIARSATARAPFRSGPVIAGCSTAVGSSTGPERPRPASAATRIFAAALAVERFARLARDDPDVQAVAHEPRRFVRAVDFAGDHPDLVVHAPPGRR